jgi:hypothetical protein
MNLIHRDSKKANKTPTDPSSINNKKNNDKPDSSKTYSNNRT